LSSSDATETDVEVPETDELREGLVARLREVLGDGLVEHHIVPGVDLWVRVSREAWQHAASSVRYTLGARYFGFLSAIDWKPSPWGRGMDSEVDKIVHGTEEKPLPEMATGYAGGDTRFQVFARVANLTEHWGITLKVDVGDEDPSVDTWTKVYAGADWHERETWEMYGITFVGHPFLRHIYLPSGFEGNPGRKDYPLLARFIRPWPGIVDVEPMPGTDEPEDKGAAEEGAS
jgi:NADH-quinone oxidoreductase subunit C